MANKKPDKKGPKDIKSKWFMKQMTGSLRRRLKEYPELGDEWVKQQLERMGKDNLFFPGVSEAIRNKAVGVESSYLEHPKHVAFRSQPGNEMLAQQTAKQLGQPYTTQISNLDPQQEQLKNTLVDWAQNLVNSQYKKIGQPVPLEQPVNDAMLKLLQQYQNGTIADQYLDIFGSGGMPQIRQNLAALGQGAQQVGQNIYNTASPYAQQAFQQGKGLASQALPYLNPQSYLSAAQPYAKRAADLGSNIMNQIRTPALDMGRQTINSLGNILSSLTGRV